MLLDTQPDSRSDRADYWAPGCDVERAYPIGMRGKTAPGADELGLRSPTRLVDASAFWTWARSARVARVHRHEGHAGEQGLVGEERAQLCERPGMQSAPLSLSNRYPVADPRQFFDGDAASGVSGLADDVLADAMILVGVEALLPPSELSKVPPRASCPSALKAGAELADARAHRQGLLAGVLLPVGVDSEVADAEVHAEPALRIDGAAVGDVHRHVEVELALAVNEVGLAPYALESPTVVGADGARNDNAPVEREKTHAVEAILEGVEALVVGDGTVLAEARELALVALVDLADLRDGADGVLRREAEAVADLVVEEPLELDLVGRLEREGLLGQPRAGLVDALHRSEQASALRFVHEQLHGSDELHEHVRSTPMRRRNQEPEQRFLPGLKAGASALEIR